MRIGGDEFPVVARCAGPTEARAFGVRRIALSADHGSTFATLIEASDAALYQAKARGRCQCVIAGAGPRLATERGRRGYAGVAPEGIAAA